jgi:hypothetical protein
MRVGSMANSPLGITSPSRASGTSLSYRTADAKDCSMAKASSEYWSSRREDRVPKPESYEPDPSWSAEYLQEIARLEVTREEALALCSARSKQKGDDDWEAEDGEDLPFFNDLEIDTLLMVRTWSEYQRCKWLDLPMAGDVPGLQVLRDQYRQLIYGDPTGESSKRLSPGDYLDFLDPDVRKAGLGYLSPPPLPAPWFSTFSPGWRSRVWRHPDALDNACLVDNNHGCWDAARVEEGAYGSLRVAPYRCYYRDDEEDGPGGEDWEAENGQDDEGRQSFDSETSTQQRDFTQWSYSNEEDGQGGEGWEAENGQDDEGRRSTLRSAQAAPAPLVNSVNKRRKKTPDPKLLSRTHGLTADLSYRNRILVTEWALINVPKSGIHRAWASSGIVPFNPQALLDTLKTEDADAKETVARQTRLKEKKQIDSMLDILNNPSVAAPDKFSQLYTTLKSAMNANNWQQRSIFADSRRCDNDQDDEGDDNDPYNEGGVLDEVGAKRLLDQEEAEEAALDLRKPHQCRLCKMRYVHSSGLQKHIAAKHSYPAESELIDADKNEGHTHANAASSNAAKDFKVCSICGGNANHPRVHEKTQKHTRALKALQNSE